MQKKFPLILSWLLIVFLLTTAGAPMGSGNNGFLTSQPAMLKSIPKNVTVQPLLTVGDVLPNGYVFESIPDGVAIDLTGNPRVDVYVNHETSTVPFSGQTDYTNAMLSKLVLQQGNGRVLDGSLVIPSSANYLRFCSNFYAGAAEGFEMPLVFTNEETNDLVNRTGTAWPAVAGSEQAGVVVAYNPVTGLYRSIYGMGRHNHENAVAIPGFGKAVVLSGDDTFSAPASQLYMYLADDAQAVWDDQGDLYAFRVTGKNGSAVDPTYAFNGANDYGEIAVGDTLTGEFIPVPSAIALGDQTALENWSNTNNVFQFIRVEDLAYDKNTPNVVYFADTGEPRAKYGVPDITGRLIRSATGGGPFPNGRIFKMTLDPSDPTVVTSLEILINGDALGSASAGVLSLIHNPDNVETTPWSLMIQEDPGSQNQYSPSDPNGTAARIWRYDLATGGLSVVAVVDQSLTPTANLGNWESSGIVDASSMFGRGAFLVTIQAHSLLIQQQVIPNPLGGTLVQKREGGQLLLLRVPGS